MVVTVFILSGARMTPFSSGALVTAKSIASLPEAVSDFTSVD